MSRSKPGPALLLLLAFVFVLSCLWSASALAQSRATSADITGAVRDDSRAVVAGARVTATNLETNLGRETVTRPDGRFVVAAVPLGVYRVRVELTGFAAAVLEPVELTLGSSVDLDVVLHPAAIVGAITVTVDRPAVDTRRTVMSSIVSQDQIAQLPANGRNFMSFSLMTPGVIADRMPRQGAAATSGLSFGGQSARSNNVTVDGFDNNDETVGGVRATFSQEAVREFQVLTQSYSAEFGKASAGVVNIVTKSGTNALAGTAFGYLRDDALNAKEHFEQFDPAGQPIDQAKAPYGQTQFGGVLGGPIRRDRTFFFGSFERLDVNASNFVTIDEQAAEILRSAGFPIATGHVPYDVTSNTAVFKIDHSVRPGRMLTLRYNYGGGYNGNTETWGGLIAESRGAALDNRDQMLAASDTSVLGSRFVNELRFQVAWRTQRLLALDPTCSGVCDRDDEGGPTIEVAGAASAGRIRTAPQRRDNTRYQVLDTLSLEAGRHSLKVGFDFNAVDHPNSSLPLNFGGRYIFAALPAVPGVLPAPVSAIQAVAAGLSAAYVQGYGNPQAPYLTQDVSAFIQDQWRVTPTVTVQAGLRYQRQFWPSHTYAAPGIGSYRIPTDSNNLAPRLGIAWNPRADSKLSLHAAYGLYYDNIISAPVAIADVVNGSADGVRTLVLRFPQSIAAWNAPGRRLSESAAGAFPSTIATIDPHLETSYSHQLSFGFERQLWGQTTLSADFLSVRGFNQLGAIDYNPLVSALGPGRRPEDAGGVAGTSASVLQYTSFGQTWYRGLTLAMRKRFDNRSQFLVSYVLAEAEDNSSDFQATFLPQSNGAGRDRNNPGGLPVGFDPAQERGPSLQDERHRFVLSGSLVALRGMRVAGIVTVGSGVPFNILAGTDLNRDGDGGNFPMDRARRSPADPASSVSRNAGRMPAEATVDLRFSRAFPLIGKSTIEPIFEVFNLFNRVNYTDVNNVFGVGAFPDDPLPTYRQFQRAAPLRQAQVAVRVMF